MTGGSLAGNSAYEGGGVYVNDGTTDISQVAVSGNTASEAGGGFWIETTPNPSRRHDDHPVDHQRQHRDRYRRREPVPGRRRRASWPTGSWSGATHSTLTNDTISGNTASVNGGGYYGTACTGPTTRVRADGPPLRHVRRQQRGQPPAGATSRPTTTRCSPWARASVASGTTGGGTNCDIAGTSTLTSKGYNLDDGTSCHLTGTGDISNKSADLGTLAPTADRPTPAAGDGQPGHRGHPPTRYAPRQG